MRLTGSRSYARPVPTPTMPPGLVELMEGLAKDVLKNNPENVYEFCAAHMQKLIEIRDGPPPPKQQLSLEQKIANAQERLRRRIKNRQLQHDRSLSEYPSEKLVHEEKQPVKEIPIDTTATRSVVHGDLLTQKEVEIFHEPNIIIASKDTSTDEAAHVVSKIIEMPQVAHEVKEDCFNATQKHETGESSEKMIEEVKENKISVDTDEKSDIDVILEPENIAGVAKQRKETDDLDIESTEHVKMIYTYGDNIEAPLNETEPSVGATGNTLEEKIDDLNDEAPGKEVVEDELNEVASTLLLASKTVDSFSNKSDDTKTDKDVVKEPKLDIKGEITDGLHEVTLKRLANEIEPEKKVDDVVNEQEIISVEECTDVNYTEKDADNIESKESIEGIVHAEENNKVEQNDDNLLPKSEDTTVGELSDGQFVTPLQTESSQNDVPVLPSTDTETLEKNNSMPVEDADLSDNQMLIVETTKKSNIVNFNNEDASDNHDADVFKDQVNYEPQINKELPYINNHLPSSAPCEESVVKDNDHIPDDTNVENNKDIMIESEETTEITAVSGMDLETAAVTTQKVFRTFLFSKSRASTLDDTVNENSLDEDIEKKDEPEYLLTSANLNKERRALGISRMDTVLQTVNEEKSLSLSDDSSLSSAATTIQAHVRGFLVRNRLASNKTASSSSLVNSDGPSTSLDDVNEPKKTILNIHIVPERGQFMSRDESLLTSIDLPLDNSPPSSINLHPLGYDKSERRKQLKREDAIQSFSPPSNNSGKLSEEVDSVKEALNNNDDVKQEHESISVNGHDKPHELDTESCETTLTISSTAETVVEAETYNPREILSSPEHNLESDNKNHEVVTSSDEMDVVTPSTITAKTASVETEDNDKPKLVHSGEFHDMVVQTQVKRSEASVVREFKNVLVYFLIWDKT